MYAAEGLITKKIRKITRSKNTKSRNYAFYSFQRTTRICIFLFRFSFELKLFFVTLSLRIELQMYNNLFVSFDSFFFFWRALIINTILYFSFVVFLQCNNNSHSVRIQKLFLLFSIFSFCSWFYQLSITQQIYY